jgi:hypothetical protein
VKLPSRYSTGYFKFGGSTIVCLFNNVEFDQDLVQNSMNSVGRHCSALPRSSAFPLSDVRDDRSLSLFPHRLRPLFVSACALAGRRTRMAPSEPKAVRRSREGERRITTLEPSFERCIRTVKYVPFPQYCQSSHPDSASRRNLPLIPLSEARRDRPSPGLPLARSFPSFRIDLSASTTDLQHIDLPLSTP